MAVARASGRSMNQRVLLVYLNLERLVHWRQASAAYHRNSCRNLSGHEQRAAGIDEAQVALDRRRTRQITILDWRLQYVTGASDPNACQYFR